MTIGGRDDASRERVLHGLRTPLSVIKGSVDVLRRHWNDLDQERRTELMDRALVNVEDLAAAIDEAHGPANGKEGRVRLEEVEVARTRVDLRAGVALSMEGAVHRGEGRAQGAGREALRAVVEATLDALQSVVGTGVVVEEVDVVSCGEERVAAVVLSWGGRRLAGSALVSSDDAGALCRATLQALNRIVAVDA